MIKKQKLKLVQPKKKFTYEELKQMRDSIKVCQMIGFCTEVYPTKEEIEQLIDELMDYKMSECF